MIKKQKLISAGRERAQAGFLQELQNLCEPWLDLPDNFGGKRAYNSLYAPSRTFWLFLWQVLAQDGSCREVVRCFLAWLARAGKRASPKTPAYCKARMRLRDEDILEAHRQVAHKVEARARPTDLWCGRRVKVVDGTSLSMPDTPKNQAAYPQPTGQKKGCGFPVMRIVAVFSLTTGTLLEMARGALAVHERTLYRSLWCTFEAGDIALNDRGFIGYSDIYYLKEMGVDTVTRNHKGRQKAVLLQRLAKNDRLVLWQKMKRHNRPDWMSEEEWEAMPDTLAVREVTVTLNIPGLRTKTLHIITTLLDHKAYPPDAIAELYRRRWAIELYFRDIKITMNMDILRCKTPEMIEKELWMHAIAYNLVRAIMLDAATTYAAKLERLSFKGTLATIRQWAPALALAKDGQEQDHYYQEMLYCIVKDPVPDRPGRSEPRARKRRPKNYPLLTQPRHQYKEIPHRSKYKKTKC